MKTGSLPPTKTEWSQGLAFCSRTLILLAFLFISLSTAFAQQSAQTGFSSTKGNFQTDADYYTNIFQFPDTPCVIPAPGTAGTDDWVGPRIPAGGGYPFGPFPVGTGFGLVDTTGAAAFKTALGCNVN